MENTYLQYFLGFPNFRDTRQLDPSMFVHFRKRFGDLELAEVNERIVMRALEQIKEPGPIDD